MIGYLVEAGLTDDLNFAFVREGQGGVVETTFPQASSIYVALRNRAYDEIYSQLVEERAYNVRLLDGGIIQMMYKFSHGVLESHRLAFFPSPFLKQFQNASRIYMDDEIYADVLNRDVVAVPVRFDYKSQDALHREVAHPKSHMTLGQYPNCRIPVTAPLTPVRFMDFVLRNFYNTAFTRHADGLPKAAGAFPDSIADAERSVVHVVVPE